MHLPLYGKEAVGEAVFLGAISAPDWMESTMTEEKIAIEQIEEFTEELSDEALDREEGAFRASLNCVPGWP